MLYSFLIYRNSINFFVYIMHKNNKACLAILLIAIFKGKFVLFIIFFKIIFTIGIVNLSLKKIL